MFSGDGTTGNARVFLARIAEEIGEDGLYLLLDQNRFASYYFRGLEMEGLYENDPTAPQTAASLARSIDQTSEAVLEGQKFRIAPVIYGVAVGVMLSIGLWYLIRLVRWSMRRNRSYLEGFE